MTSHRSSQQQGLETAAKWHEEQAFEAEAEHLGVQGTKSQKWRKRFHLACAEQLRALSPERNEDRAALMRPEEKDRSA